MSVTFVALVYYTNTVPTADDLWQLQADLLAFRGETAHKAREVAGEFHSYLRNLESKMGSRGASRWGVLLATAAVSSVGSQEMIAEHEDPLKRLLASGVTAMLEVGSAAKHVQVWELEAALMYYDDVTKSALLAKLFQVVLAAQIWPLLKVLIP